MAIHNQNGKISILDLWSFTAIISRTYFIYFAYKRLAATIPPLKTVLYADYTNIVASDADLNVLGVKAESALTNSERWFSANKLTLNVDKTTLVQFSTESNPYVDNNRFSTHAPFLGPQVDDNLRWERHIYLFTGKLSYSCYSMKL